MRRIGDRNFLHAWQMIRAGTQPDPEATAWAIGDVSCRRYRHSFAGPDYSAVIDVCHVGLLERKAGWRVVISAETWWDAERLAFRAQLWASHLAGPRDDAVGWFAHQASLLETRQ